jgi:CRP-like cAMP-binding protein
MRSESANLLKLNDTKSHHMIEIDDTINSIRYSHTTACRMIYVREKQASSSLDSGAQSSAQDTASFLARTAIFQHLDVTEIHVLEHAINAHRLAPGQMLYRPGEPATALFLLRTGSLQLYHLSTDGRQLITAILEQNACFGERLLAENNVQTCFAEAITASSIYSIPRSELNHLLARHPEIIYTLFQVMQQRMAQLETQLVNTTFKGVTARLASLLLQLARPQKKQLSVHGLTHEDLADHLGVYRETVSTVLRELKDAGIIVPGRRHITINQPSLLQQIAETGGKMGLHIREYL